MGNDIVSYYMFGVCSSLQFPIERMPRHMSCQGWLFAYECKAPMDVMHHQILVDVVLCHWCLVVSMDLLDWTLKWSRAHWLREIFPESQTNHWGCCRGYWFERRSELLLTPWVLIAMMTMICWLSCLYPCFLTPWQTKIVLSRWERDAKLFLSLQTGWRQVECLTWDTVGCWMWRWLSLCEGWCCYKTCETWATRFVLRLVCWTMPNLNRLWLSLAWLMTSANGFL